VIYLYIISENGFVLQKKFLRRAGAPGCRSHDSLKEYTPLGRAARQKEPGAELLEMAVKFKPFSNVH
jgi:hypothetical protein